MKLISRLQILPMLTLLGALTTANSFGGIIFQNVGYGDAQIAVYDPIGQSFVADDVQLTTVAFAFSNMNPASTNAPVTMSLYQGAGFRWTPARFRHAKPARLPARHQRSARVH
jgi:hypothetical protein